MTSFHKNYTVRPSNSTSYTYCICDIADCIYLSSKRKKIIKKIKFQIIIPYWSEPSGFSPSEFYVCPFRRAKNQNFDSTIEIIVQTFFSFGRAATKTPSVSRRCARRLSFLFFTPTRFRSHAAHVCILHESIRSGRRRYAAPWENETVGSEREKENVTASAICARVHPRPGPFNIVITILYTYGTCVSGRILSYTCVYYRYTLELGVRRTRARATLLNILFVIIITLVLLL